MTPEAAFEFIGLLACLLAVGWCVRGGRRMLPAETRWAFHLLLVISVVKYALNGVEWLVGVGAPAWDHVEDHLDALWPATWFVFALAAVMGMSTRDLKRVNARLNRALRQVEEVHSEVVRDERLRAVGRMATGVAHDFNNSLQPILGYTDMLLSNPAELDDPVHVTERLRMIRSSAAAASSVVRRLRDFYRPRDLGARMECVGVLDLIEDAVSLTQPSWKEQARARGCDITIRTRLQRDLVLAGDRAELRDVMTNLILNAVDAMPEGGVLEVAACDEGACIALTVADDGKGMSPEVKEHCLEPFFTTKDGMGTGLGLSLAYGVVERHSGTIEIESEPFKGTRITLRIPKGRPMASGRDEHPATLELVASLRILLVDDEVTVRAVLQRLLETDGHVVTAAADGPSALEMAEKGTFDLVISDHAMPGMTGSEMAERLRAAGIDIPMLMLTGFGGMGEYQEVPWVDEVLGKPVTRAQLRDGIDRACARAAERSRHAS